MPSRIKNRTPVVPQNRSTDPAAATCSYANARPNWWSSYGEYLKIPDRRVPWLRVDRLLGENGIPKDNQDGRKEFRARMEQRRWAQCPAEWKKIRRGWYLGDEQF